MECKPGLLLKGILEFVLLVFLSRSPTIHELAVIFFKFGDVNIRLQPFRIMLDPQIVVKQERMSLCCFFH